MKSRDYTTKRGAKGHSWKRREDGTIDIFAFSNDEGSCNGPRCTKCDYGFCHHCRKVPAVSCSATRATSGGRS